MTFILCLGCSLIALIIGFKAGRYGAKRHGAKWHWQTIETLLRQYREVLEVLTDILERDPALIQSRQDIKRLMEKHLAETGEIKKGP